MLAQREGIALADATREAIVEAMTTLPTHSDVADGLGSSVAPDGTAVMFDENVALIEQAGRVAFDLKSTDWTFEQGHQLGVQVETIGSGSWRDTPSGNTIGVTGRG